MSTLRPTAKTPRRLLTALFAGSLAALICASPQPAAGFCGFYVAGADASLYNDATLVVMMRDGTRTVLAMQNDYQGPPEDFALVIPVPVVLQEDNVKVLPKSIFERVDKLSAPRLVEYWEEDPCQARVEEERMRNVVYDAAPPPSSGSADGQGVTIEAQFEVGEYQIVILSATEATGLDNWLRSNKYNIPEGAEPVLRPYVESGMKFFVAKVDVTKVQFEAKPDGGQRAMLSPLRFHYDSEEFALPVRLGLINAKGPQDLLIHVLAPETRYQVANYPNVTIPTNLVVKDQVREHFGEFYVSLFDHTLAQTPKAVVTEYAWSAAGCDPCPEPALDFDELQLLGANVLPRYADSFDAQGQLLPAAESDGLRWRLASDFVLTRLHARYDKDSLGEDLVFEQAPGLMGGRGVPQNRGQLDPAVSTRPGPHSSFQARYAILHFWEGAVQCKDPLWDSWGGPPAGQGGGGPAVARELAFVDRGTSLASYVTRSAHQSLKLAGEPPAEELPPRPDKTDADERKDGASKPDAGKPDAGKPDADKKGCACSSEQTPIEGPAGPLALFALFTGLFVRNHRRNHRPR